jgi:hypothetical protein
MGDKELNARALRTLSLKKADVIAYRKVHQVPEEQAIADLIQLRVSGKNIAPIRGYRIPGWEKMSRIAAAKSYFRKLKT